MPTSLRVWLPLACSVLALGACKDRGTADQESRPLPSPEPPSSATPSLPREDAAPAKKRVVDDEPRPSKRPAVEETQAAAPAAASAESPAATAAVTPSAAPPVSATAAPLPAAPSSACLARCQGALQGCLSQPVDGGVPGFANLELCKKAFEACQAACAP